MSQSKRKKNAPTKTSVRPTQSRTPFFILLAAIVVVGGSAIVYKMNSAPKPIVLPQGAALPKAEGYLLGDPNAPVTIMEFADFECPVCGDFSTVTEPDVRSRIIDKGLANIRYYDFPLSEMHPNTLFASLAASCAADQDKFWPMHDALLTGQLEWSAAANGKKNPKPVFDGYAKRIGLDMGKFDKCFDARDNLDRIEANHQAGIAYQVSSTPSFVIGGKMYPGALHYDNIKAIVDSVRLKAGIIDANAPKPGVVPLPPKLN